MITGPDCRGFLDARTARFVRGGRTPFGEIAGTVHWLPDHAEQPEPRLQRILRMGICSYDISLAAAGLQFGLLGAVTVPPNCQAPSASGGGWIESALGEGGGGTGSAIRPDATVEQERLRVLESVPEEIDLGPVRLGDPIAGLVIEMAAIVARLAEGAVGARQFEPVAES